MVGRIYVSDQEIIGHEVQYGNEIEYSILYDNNLICGLPQTTFVI